LAEEEVVVKPRTTLILFGVFAVLLAFILIFESRGKKAAAEKEKEDKLVDLASADVQKIEVRKDDGTVLALAKDDKGDWKITSPLEAKADATEANSLATTFASLHIDRVVDKTPKDLKDYGLPKDEVSLWVKGSDKPITVLIGMENPLDQSFFAKRADDPRVVLLSSSLKYTLDKKLFDYREKDVFKFETGEVKSVSVHAGGVSWEAVREGDAWRLASPVRALAVKNKIDSLLDSLSGLRAKEFVSEDKAPADVKKFGLDKPAYTVTLKLPAANKDIVFSLQKEGDKSYALTSQSNKIISFEGTLLADLDKKPDELRDKKAADFYSWEVDRISVKAGGLTLAAVKEKAQDGDKWFLETPSKEPADGTKVEALIRKIEGLEAAEFIDDPGSLARYGLEKPAAEIRIRTKDVDNKTKEIGLLVGNEDAAKKQVVVKNAGLDYLFRVDASFLQDLPKETKDWKAEPPKPEAEPEKK
jgi:hypothetical protein